MEADDGRVRETPRQRAEPGERPHRLALREARRPRRGLRDGVFRGERAPPPRTAARPRRGGAAARARGRSGASRRRRRRARPRARMRSWPAALGAEGSARPSTIGGRSGAIFGIEEVLRGHRLGRVGELRSTRCSCRTASAARPRPEKRPARDGAARQHSGGARRRAASACRGRRPASGRRRRRSGRRPSGSARRRASAASALPCRRSRSPRSSAFASASLRTPKSRVSGGLPCRGFVTAPAAGRLAARLEPCDRHRARDGERRGDRDDGEHTRPGGHRGESVARPRAAIFPKVMPSYRELLQQVRAEIDEVDAAQARELLDVGRAAAPRRRARARRMGRGPPPRRDPRPARQPRVAHRARRPRPRAADRRLLPARQPLRVRGEDARGARLRERRLARRRLHRLEAQRLPDAAAPHARRREALALQPPPADPRGRRGGAAEAARVAHPADRRRRPRLARRRSISPRPASAGSASSTTTASTRRTCSARSRTRRRRSATGRSTRRSARSKR